MTKIEELIQKRNLIKQLTEEAKQLEQELIQEGIEKEQVWDYTVSKTTRMTLKLKPWIDKEDIVNEYPEATKLQVDTKALSKIAEAQKFLDIQETEYLTIKQKK